jgi:hypothetical protein
VSTTLLPPAFAALEPYAAAWCLPTETERFDQRMRSTMDELTEFYDAMTPLLEEAIELCDKHELADLPEDVARLLQLIYSYVMIAMAVEIFSQPKTVDAADAVLIRIAEPTP